MLPCHTRVNIYLFLSIPFIYTFYLLYLSFILFIPFIYFFFITFIYFISNILFTLFIPFIYFIYTFYLLHLYLLFILLTPFIYFYLYLAKHECISTPVIINGKTRVSPCQTLIYTCDNQRTQAPEAHLSELCIIRLT